MSLCKLLGICVVFKEMFLKTYLLIGYFYFTAYTAQADEKTGPGTPTDAHARALLVCNGPLEHYDFLIKQEELKYDEQQRRVVQHLQKLHESLKGYSIDSKNVLSKVRFIMIKIFFAFIFAHKNVLKMHKFLSRA